MIKDIEIENFRCFEHTKIEGFERVNLIGGKNNSGKTALLEAILLNQSPLFKNIILLRKLRQESIEFSKSFPEKTWDNFFFQQNTVKPVSIITKIPQQHQQKFSDLPFSDLQLTLSVSQSLEAYEKEIEAEETINFLFNTKLQSVLHLRLVPRLYGKFPNYTNNDNASSALISSDSQGIKQYKNKTAMIDILQYQKVVLLPAYIRLHSRLLAEEYDKADFNDKSIPILGIIRIIDPSIKSIKTFSIGEPQIYLQRENENYLPISMFGDAVNRVTEIILKVINNQSSIILIDEIENGIHYTNHRDFWKALFELSKELNVQIFATTHSLEMIKAFRDVGLEYYPDSGAYFEMARNPRTNNIVGIKHELEMLDYALKRNEGVRGE